MPFIRSMLATLWKGASWEVYGETGHLALVIGALVIALTTELLDQVPLKFLSRSSCFRLWCLQKELVIDLLFLWLHHVSRSREMAVQLSCVQTWLFITSSFRLRVITLEGFFPPLHKSEEEAMSHLLCLVRALTCYIGVPSVSLCTTEIDLRDFLCVHSTCHTDCVRLFYRYISPLGRIPQRTSGCTPPEGFHPPLLCLEECQWKTCALQLLGLPPGLCSFICFYLQDVSCFSMTLYRVFCQNDGYWGIRWHIESYFSPYSPPRWTVTVRTFCLCFLTAIGFIYSQHSSLHTVPLGLFGVLWCTITHDTMVRQAELFV